MSLTDAGALLEVLYTLQLNKKMRINPEIPLTKTTLKLAGALEWSIRDAADAIALLRDDGYLVANSGGGYFLAEKREHMAATLGLYKRRAMTALCRLKKMQDATNLEFPPQTINEAQRDFFKEAIDEA